MQDTTLSRIKTPPMMIGLFLAGLLLFAVVGVVRNVTSMTTAIPVQNNALSAVQAAVQQPMQSAGQPLPAFVLVQSQPQGQPQVQPAVYSVSVNQPQPLTVDTPEWLAIRSGPAMGDRQVFAGLWLPCNAITVDGRFVGQGPTATQWEMIGPESRQAVLGRCMGADVSTMAQLPAALATATPVRPQWLDMTTDSAGERWVWIGEWFVACNHIDMNYAYHNDRDLEAVAAWNRLPFDDQTEVRSKCRE